jgi:hypothetical protein
MVWTFIFLSLLHMDWDILPKLLTTTQLEYLLVRFKNINPNVYRRQLSCGLKHVVDNNFGKYPKFQVAVGSTAICKISNLMKVPTRRRNLLEDENLSCRLVLSYIDIKIHGCLQY